MCADDNVGCDLGAVQYRGVHADKDVVADNTGMYHRAVTYDDVVANDHIATAVHHAVVLRVGVVADGYLAEVGTDYCAGPDGGVFADLHVTDDVR